MTSTSRRMTADLRRPSLSAAPMIGSSDRTCEPKTIEAAAMMANMFSSCWPAWESAGGVSLGRIGGNSGACAGHTNIPDIIRGRGRSPRRAIPRIRAGRGAAHRQPWRPSCAPHAQGVRPAHHPHRTGAASRVERRVASPSVARHVCHRRHHRRCRQGTAARAWRSGQAESRSFARLTASASPSPARFKRVKVMARRTRAIGSCPARRRLMPRRRRERHRPRPTRLRLVGFSAGVTPARANHHRRRGGHS